ncbi:DUF2076 family protein [Elioraea sp.]|uniref:DUF2076 family protein n=1 Tax=Elioraea sp. TaxID=2185103 RepID=UPI0025B90287|nr:DUF2076 family protein [Elioraea sp.]
MTGDEATLIARLFERLGGLAGLSHDPEAMRYAADQAGALADPAGVMAQVLLAQEAAIASLRARLSALERDRAAEAAWQVGAARYLTLEVTDMPRMPAPDGSFLQGVFAAAAAFASGKLLMDAELAAPLTPDGGEFHWGGGGVEVKKAVPEEDWYAIKGATPPDEPPPDQT